MRAEGFTCCLPSEISKQSLSANLPDLPTPARAFKVHEILPTQLGTTLGILALAVLS